MNDQVPQAPPHFEPPQRVWPPCFVASYTDYGRKERRTSVYFARNGGIHHKYGGEYP